MITFIDFPFENHHPIFETGAHLIDKTKYHQPNSKVVKLHYEKYSPLFRDDFKELEIFLDDIVPLLESDEHKFIDILDEEPRDLNPGLKKTFPPQHQVSDIISDHEDIIDHVDHVSHNDHVNHINHVNYVDHVIHDDHVNHDDHVDHLNHVNHVTPVAVTVGSDKPILHDVDPDLYISPFHSPLHPQILPSSTPLPSLQTLKSLENEQERYYESNSLKPNKYFSGLIPHAINIQINIPPADDRKYKDSDTYREVKHISVTEKPGYVSPLNGVVHYESTPLPVHYDSTPKPHYESTPLVPLPPALPPLTYPLLPGYNPTVSPKVPEYKTPHPTTIKPHLLPYHPQIPSHSYEAPHSNYLPPRPSYETPRPASYDVPPTPHHLIRDFKPPHAEYLPPSDDYFPPSSTIKPYYEPPVKDYLPPKLPSYHETSPTPLLPTYEPPSKEYLPPSSHIHHTKPGYEPPSKEYLPPPSHIHHAKPGYEPPSKEYLPPPSHVHHTKPGYEPPSKEYLPPTDYHHADHPHHHHPSPGYDHMKPPSKEYLPPIGHFPPGPEVITDIDGEPIGLLHPPSKDYLPPPPRLESGLDKKYVPPPPRTNDVLTVPDILNSHIEAPRGDVDHYIPPKTLHDVPKNFIRPEDALPPAPELLDIDLDNLDDLDDDSIEITLEDLESLGLPGLENLGLNDLTSVEHPFLGLAKFRDGRPKSDEKRKGTRKSQKETITLKEDDKFEKLRVSSGKGDVPFPPMPTLAPDSVDNVPIIERLRPEVLAQLRQAQAAGGGGGGGSNPGFIPGKAGVDYPDFRSIPATDFTCENFILPGFYADTFTSCQVCCANIKHF